MKVLLLSLICLMTLTACNKSEDSTQTLDKQFDRSGEVNYDIRMHIFSSRRDMQRACALRAGTEVNLSLDECTEWAEDSIAWGCDIYVVDIRHMTDNGNFSAWGHGLAHCMYGHYHPER
jgi:hypothetical protein